MKGITLKTFLVAAGSLLAAASLTFSSGAGAETTLELRARLVAQAAATRAATWADAAAQAAAKRIEAAASLAKARCEADNARRRYGMLPGPVVDCTKLAAAGLPPAPPPAPTVSYAWALTTAYTPCSKSCGGGTQLQIVSCQDSSHNNATASLCTAAKPSGASRSCNTTACSLPTPPPTTCTDTTPPTVPGSVTATPISCSEMKVSWSASTDAGCSGLAGYDVSLNGARLTTPSISPTQTLSWTDKNVKPFTTYGPYLVKACDNKGNCSSAMTSSATTPVCGGPVVLGSVAGVGFPDELVSDPGGRIVVARYLGSGLTVIDTADPAHPSIASQINLGHLETGVSLAGAVAYVVEETNGNTDLAVIDLSNPRQPALLGRTPIPGKGGGGIAIQGSLAYVGNSFGLHVVDLTAATAPRVLRSIPTTAPIVSKIAAGDGFLVAQTASAAGLARFDTRAPENPTFAGFLGASPAFVVRGPRLYIGLVGNLFLYDFGNGSQTQIGSFVVGAPSLEVVGNRVFLPNYAGLDVYDLSQPTQLKLVGTVTLGNQARKMASAGAFLAAVDYGGTLSLISTGP